MTIARIVVALLMLFAVPSLGIRAEEYRWAVRFHGALVAPSTDEQSRLDDGVVAEIDAGGGLGVGAEVRLSHRVGLEFSALAAALEYGTRVSAYPATVRSYHISLTPLSLGVPIHFDVGERVNLFAAPTVSFVRYTDFGTTIDGHGVESRVDVDDDVGFGIAIGLDVPFGRGRWALNSGLRYIETDAGETDIDPVIVTIGGAVRF